MTGSSRNLVGSADPLMSDLLVIKVHTEQKKSDFRDTPDKERK